MSVVIVASIVGIGLMSTPNGNPSYIKYSGDALITQEIKFKLLANTITRGTTIAVKTQAGAVLLSGYTANEEEKSAAESIAYRVRGVKSVSNEVAVRP